MKARQRKKNLRKDYAPFIHYKKWTVREMRKLDAMLQVYNTSFQDNKRCRDIGNCYLALTEWKWVQT